MANFQVNQCSPYKWSSFAYALGQMHNCHDTSINNTVQGDKLSSKVGFQGSLGQTLSSTIDYRAIIYNICNVTQLSRLKVH